MKILQFTENGIKTKQVDEKTFFIVDAKEFLQTLFESLIEESVSSIGGNMCSLIKDSIELLKQEYEILPDENSDLINSFLSINPENIQNRESLLDAHKKSVAIKKLTNTNFLSKEDARIIGLAFFNDTNLKDLIDDIKDPKQMKSLEKQSLYFKENVKNFLKANNKENKEINYELSKDYPKSELPIFNALLDDLLYNISTKTATQKAYKSCQNYVTFKNKKESKKRLKLVSFIKHTSNKKTQTLGEKE